MNNEYGLIKRMALRHARDGFHSEDRIADQWQELHYISAPNYRRAVEDYDRLVGLFEEQGITLDFIPMEENLSMDAVYVRDATIVSEKGMVLCNMGKETRKGEPAVAGRYLEGQGFPVLGAIEGKGRLEGGDFIRIDAHTCAVGHGYRTNAEGIRQLGGLLGPEVEMVVVPLPHFKGPGDVFHLMSFVSPLDADLMLVYSPVMPVPFRQWLLSRGIRFVEVPDEEFATMACNVLALGPRRCLVMDGNPETRRRLESAGCRVIAYEGCEISRKGEGGPTCLTRPLVRE